LAGVCSGQSEMFPARTNCRTRHNYIYGKGMDVPDAPKAPARKSIGAHVTACGDT